MRRLAALVCIVGALACHGALAQSRADDETAVRAADEAERLAVLKQDVTAMQKLWSENFMVNSPGNTVVSNRAAVIDLVHNGMIHYSSFERQIESLRFYDDVAVIMGSETVRPIGKAPGAGQTVQRRFTAIWRKEGGRWQQIARHANTVPQR